MKWGDGTFRSTTSRSWFAWRPVRLDGLNRWVWLERVWAKQPYILWRYFENKAAADARYPRDD